MAEEIKRGRGRPPKLAEDRKRNNLTMRLRDATKATLESEAAANQRSLSEEAETRIERTFHTQALLTEVLALTYGNDVAAILREIGWVMKETGPSAGFAKNRTLEGARDWIGDAYAFNQTAAAVTTILERRRPEGDPSPPPAIGHRLADEVHKNLGVMTANTLLDVVDGKIAPPTARLGDEAAEIRKIRGGNRDG